MTGPRIRPRTNWPDAANRRGVQSRYRGENVDRLTIRTQANGCCVSSTLMATSTKCRPGHTVKLGRCGHSAKKPFCDQTHHPYFVPLPAFQPEEREAR